MSRNRPYTDFPRNEQGLVDNFIGTAYDTVKRVYDSLPEIKRLDDVLTEIPTLAQTSVDNAIAEALPAVREELQEYVDSASEEADRSSGFADAAKGSADAAALSAIEAAKVSLMFPFLFDTNQLVYDVTVIAGRTDITTAGMVLWVEGAIEYDFTILSGTQFTLNQPSAYPQNAQMRLIANARFDDIVKNFDELQAGFEDIFQEFLANSGFEVPVPYVAGISITRGTQTVTYLGRDYRVNTPYLPLVTSTWAFDSPKMVLVGEGTLRADITDPTEPSKGVSILGRAGVMVDSVADLLLQPRRKDLRFLVDSYYAGTGVGGNIWKWDPDSVATPDYGSVQAVAGVGVGRFVVVKNIREFSAYEFGVRAENTGTDNRLRLTALYRHLHGSANKVTLIDEDFYVDASRPIIVPADIDTFGGRGTLIPVLESPLLAATTAANPDGTFKCYGGIFAGGDPVTGNRYSETNFIYRGRNTFTGVKIRNATGLTAASGYSLHGMISHGGICVYIDCEVDDMPNTGIVTTMYRECHHIRTKCRRNGLLGGGGARNGVSNTSTYSITSAVFPEADRTTKLSIIGGQFTHNYEEGIQFANVPFVWIDGPDCRFNLDRAIEGDSAYPQTTQTRPNDQIHIYGADCRGVPGSSNYSVALYDGYNKDVFMGDCRFGGGRRSEVSANCSPVGSFTFTSRNKFDLTNVGLENGCHAIYVNAGLIDLSVGFTVRGNHDRTALNASMVSANNDISSGDVFMGEIDCDVKFLYGVTAKLTTVFKSKSVTCPTDRSYALLTLTANTNLIEISDTGGLLNQSGTSDQGLVRILGLDVNTLNTLRLHGNICEVNALTRFPVATSATAVVGRIAKLYSSGNYWKGFTFSGGAERITALAGLAAKTSAQDLPLLA